MTKNKIINLELILENKNYVLISDDKTIKIIIKKNEIKGEDIFNQIYSPNFTKDSTIKINITTKLKNKDDTSIFDQLKRLFDEINNQISEIKLD